MLEIERLLEWCEPRVRMQPPKNGALRKTRLSQIAFQIILQLALGANVSGLCSQACIPS